MKKLPVVIVWAIAFAFMESAIVEYLRALYYPLNQGGFHFPVLTLEDIAAMGEEHRRRLAIELGREISTLIMLAGMGIVAARNRREAWAYFIISFGVWDIFYYIWLKIFIDWPPGLMTWDLLFLIPVPWVSPVLAPIVVSLVMIFAGTTVLLCEANERPLKADWLHWAAISLGGVLVIVSFCQDYRNIMNGGLPSSFDWPLFVAGLVLATATFLLVFARNRL